ncbi:CYFA0S20e01904g1_1 [Cyberlindnera fabianii]|uniref:CYFA0S20e01904g1_1 n=1 Tax=Cyberlindnera fabianii TaxID=36022 RepID=A0A061B7N7_CYBFA|nr:CYFA0S20e01904g1_1 [Cyberlindnera fabianii]
MSSEDLITSKSSLVSNQSDNSTKFQYRNGIGVGLNKQRDVNPLKMFTSSPMQTRSQPSPDSEIEQEAIPSPSNHEEIGESEKSRWGIVDDLFAQHEELQRRMEARLENLREIHGDMELLLNEPAATMKNHKMERPSYLPTPEDDDDGEMSDQHKITTRFTDIPSSPESYTSQMSQLEIDIGQRMQEMTQRDPHNRDVIKLKNVATSMVDLLRYEVQDEDGIIKLMNLSDDIHGRSERLISSFDRMLDTFME